MKTATGTDRTEAFAARPWARLLERALGPATGVPTMLTAEEQKLYYWITAFWTEGTGDIVDLGCFAGGSTARLAEGQRAAGRARGVHAFDRFTAGAEVKQSILYEQGVAPFEGSDILPLAKSLLEPWAPAVTFHRGEIDRKRWSGGPIEVLVMDASKAAETGDRMAETFFPHLIAGASLLVQQDFLHWSQPWVPAQMERLAAHFRPLAHVERDTVVFLCEHTPTLPELRKASVAGLDDAALDAALVAAETRYTAWGLADRVADMRAGLAANPGKRRAHQFQRPVL